MTLPAKTVANLPFLLAFVMLCSGCLKEPADPAGAPGDKVVILLESPPRDLDPRFVTDSSSSKVSRLIFCSLTTNETEDLRPQLEVATSIEPDCEPGVEPCLDWVIRLRDDVFWHDGERVTAEDVVYTFESILDEKLGSPFRGDLSRKIESIEAVDGAVHIRLQVPVATFFSDLSIGLVPRHILGNSGDTSGTFTKGYVGCGPFRFVEQYREQKVVLSRFEEYFKPVGPETVVVRTVTDEATRILSIMAGSGHIVVNGISPPVVSTLEDEPQLKVLNHPAACTTYMTFNLMLPRLAKEEVRRAIALAIDRQNIVEEQFRGMAVLARSILPPMHWAFNSDLPEIPYDPELAEKLLDKAGYPRDPETGIRFELTLKVTVDRFRKNIGAIIAHQLQRVGIEVRLLPLELSTFLSDVRKGNFELYILQVPEVIDPDILRWLLHSQSSPEVAPREGSSRYGLADRTLFTPHFKEVQGPYADECRTRWFPFVVETGFGNWLRSSFGMPTQSGSGNRSFFFDPTLDCLLDLGFTTMAEEKRLGYYREAQRIAMDALPILPLWHEDNVGVVNRAIEGYRLLPINRYGPVIEVR